MPLSPPPHTVYLLAPPPSPHRNGTSIPSATGFAWVLFLRLADAEETRVVVGAGSRRSPSYGFALLAQQQGSRYSPGCEAKNASVFPDWEHGRAVLHWDCELAHSNTVVQVRGPSIFSPCRCTEDARSTNRRRRTGKDGFPSCPVRARSVFLTHPHSYLFGSWWASR
jgi:hypothetical protein